MVLSDWHGQIVDLDAAEPGREQAQALLRGNQIHAEHSDYKGGSLLGGN